MNYSTEKANKMASKLGIKGNRKPGDMITKSNEAIKNGLKAVKGTSKKAVMIKGLI